MLSEFKIDNSREDLALLANDYPESLVALEVGTHSPWISRYLQALGMEVVVANPRKVKYISENIRKSDKRDTQILAKFVRLDPELLWLLGNWLLGNCFWREGFEAAFGPDRMGEKGG